MIDSRAVVLSTLKPLSFHCKQRGAALVELTIVLSLLMLPIFFGILELGRLIYSYKTLVHQVHHTARYLSVQSPDQNLIYLNCFFKAGKLQDSCSDLDSLLKGFNDSSFKLDVVYSSERSDHPVTFNVVTVKAINYQHKFIFDSFFNAPLIAFESVSATFRQVR